MAINKKQFMADYNEIVNKNQGQTQTALDDEKARFIADYNRINNIQETTVPKVTNKMAVQQYNYNAMQNAFKNVKTTEQYEKELQGVDRQINNLLAVQSRDAAERQRLKNLLEQRKNLNAKLGNPTAGERAKLSAASIGKTVVASPVAAANLGWQVSTDPVEMEISRLERQADLGVLDAAGWARLNELKPQQGTKELNTSGWSWQKLREAEELRKQASKGFNAADQFAYDTAMSMATNLVTLPANLIAPGASLALMGTQSMANKALEVADNGGSAAEAFGRGLAAGGIEMLTEAVSLDTLSKAFKGQVGKTVIGKTINSLIDSGKISPVAVASLEQAFSEGGEELVSAIANWAADKAAGDPDAKLSAQDLVLSFLGGAISGGTMGAGAYGAGRIIDKTENGFTSAEIANKTAKNGAYNAENEVLSAENRKQLENQVKEIVGIDTRTEGEKVADKERERISAIEKMAAKGFATPEQVENVRQSVEENIAEAQAKESLDYAVELIKYAGKEADIYSDSRDSAAAYNTAKRIGINLAHSNTTAMGRAVHEVGHDKTQSEQWQNYTAALDRLIATDGRLVKLMDDIDYAYRNNEDAEVRASVSFEDGTINNAKIREEQYLKLTEIMLPNIAKGDKQLLDAIKKDRNVLDNLLDFIRGIKNKVSIKLTKSEAAMLDEAERQLVNLLRSKSKENTENEKDYSIAEHIIDSNGTDYGKGVVLDTKIFDNVSPRKWNEIIRPLVYNKLKGSVITVYNGKEAEDIYFAKEKERVNGRLVLDKLARHRITDNIRNLSIVHVAELAEASKYETTTDDNTHQWLDENGWELRTVYIQDKKGNVFTATLNIAKSRDGRKILYDISNIKKVEASKGPSVTESKGRATSSTYKNNIPQTKENSNGNNLLKEKQLEIVTNANPMTDNYHTGIRSVDDILTAEEAFAEDNFGGTPDWTQADADKAINNGKVTVYSSYPIENGVFVSPSKMEAQSYAGNSKVYSKTVDIKEVAWIDSEQGQYAPTENITYSLQTDIDSNGNKLTKKQADYFKNSVVRNEKGELLTVYHQTDADFTEFNTKSTGAGKYDEVMPDGIFVKPTEADIGLKGKKQMALYANITNPLQFRDRQEMVGYWNKNIPGYAEIQKQIAENDVLYQQKYNAADLLEDEQYKKIRKQLMNKEITADEFRQKLEETETKKILAEWTSTSDALRAQAKELINGYIADNDFDGIILENDAGSFGRKVKSYVVFNSNQLKNTDNVSPTSKPDIRYSLQTDIDANEYWGENSKSRAVERHAVNEFTNYVAELLGVEYKDKTEILKKQAWKMADAAKKTGMFNSQQMINFFNDAYNLGKQESGNLDERNKQLKKELHNLGIKPLKGREYLDFVQRYKGKIMFNRNGMDIDIAYKQLAEDYPEWFSEDITNPYDMMNRIGEVYDSIQGKKVFNTEYFGEDAEAFRTAAFQQYSALVDNFIDTLNSVSRYRLALADQKQQEEAASKKVYTIEDVKAARELAQPLMKEIARMERKNLFTAEDRDRLNNLLELKHPADIADMQERLRATNPLAEDIIAMYDKKKMLEAVKKPIYEYNKQRKARLKSQFLEILQTADSWKDKDMPMKYYGNTFERNIDDIVTDKKAAEKLKDILPRQIHKHVADATRYKNKLRDKIRGFNIDTTKKYNIEVQAAGELLKGEATEADLIQMYGEGIVTKQYLDKIGANTKKIVETADKFREIYNELFEKINEAYVANGYAPMEYRQDYFPHFFDETGDALLNKVGQFLGFDAKNMLPTEIAGRTHEFSPGRQWNSHSLQRKGEKTDYNVLKGFDNYIEAAANIIHLTEDIQNLRAFENAIRYKYSDEGMKAELDAIDALPISEDEKQDQREKILKTENRNTKLNNFVVYEHEYANILAGKKSVLDRTVEGFVGRRFYTVAKNVENRVAANMIAGNVSSALTNFIPLTQLTAEVDSRYIFTAMSDTIKNIKNNDGIVEMSDFLTNRFGSEMLSLTTMQKLANKAGAPMALVDEFTSNVVTRARYLQNVDKGGMDSASAMSEADEYAASLMADRSKGALPVIFESKNPLIKLFTMFQVEQANQLNYLFKDLPRKNKEKAKSWMIWALIKLGVFSFLYNLLFEQLAGRKPAFSPVDMIVDTGKDIAQVKKGEMKASAALSNSFVRTMENLPYASSVLAVTGLSEDAGRIPVSGALPDFSQLAYLADHDVSAEKKKAVAIKELTKPTLYLATPFAGGQAKKIVDAGVLYGKNEGVQYSIQSDGSKKVQFANDPSAAAFLQAATFGKWASKPAQEYIDSGFKGLSKNQTKAFEGLKNTGLKNSEATAMVKGIKEADTNKNGSYTIEEAKAWLNKQNLTREQKAILFTCMCPTVKNNPYK